jgi:hypothetical protein
MSLPIVTVLSGGSPKLAAVCVSATKSAFRQRAIPGADVRQIDPRDRKYDASERSAVRG